jgi:hypothetical protein
MPQIGEIALGCDVGVSRDRHKAVWHACQDCGTERWVLLRRGQPQSVRCFKCSRDYPGRVKTIRRGADHWHWRGGRSVTTGGYIQVWLRPEDPFFPMADKDAYVYEHRLIVARSLGRCLEPAEEVHHLDGDKGNNSLENLELLSKSEHAARHSSDVMRLLRRIAELEAENEALRGVSDDTSQAEDS